MDHLEGQHYHVLRFNSRGVGKSTGWASFTGFNEADDLGELVKWALGRIPDVSTLVLVVSISKEWSTCVGSSHSTVTKFVVLQGYSHGSLIASLQPIIQTVRTLHVLISYPLGPRGFLTLFHTSAYVTRLKQLVQDIDSKVLILYGDQDDFTAVTRYRAWKENLQGEAGEDCEDRLKFVEIAGGSHFWRGQAGQRLWEEVRRWLP